MVVAAPTTKPAKPGFHIVDTVGHTRPLWVGFPAAQPQTPHRLYIWEQNQRKPQSKLHILANPRKNIPSQDTKPNENEMKFKCKTNQPTFEPRHRPDRTPFHRRIRLRPIPPRSPSVHLHKGKAFGWARVCVTFTETNPESGRRRGRERVSLRREGSRMVYTILERSERARSNDGEAESKMQNGVSLTLSL